MDLNVLKELAVDSPARIVLLVLDGLGGLAQEPGGKTELETARTPNLDALAAKSSLGLINPVAPGITPGSGPGHLGLFGYDPVTFTIGRGVLEALGIGFNLKDTDVAARGNFCSLDAQGMITDRRAGRISTETCVKLCDLLRSIKLPGVEVFVEPVKEHRFVLVLRGDGLDDHLSETDPQRLGVPPLDVQATTAKSKKTADLINAFAREARIVLAPHHPANMVLLRGFAKHPDMLTLKQLYGLNPAAIAVYPMYKGLATLAGMEILPIVKAEGGSGTTIAEEFLTLKANYDTFTFFFMHIKGSDSAGEDGDFARKVSVIEEVDRHIPELLALNPDVVMVTGDHSTPAVLKSHSWHPVPFLLYSRYTRADGVAEFGERACARGSLGTFLAKDGLVMALSCAGRLTKYGA
jgi:2,3-bisphosphoglycerate-independent phosphoglycerate mutase